MDTKLRILIAAETLFAKQGFSQTSMREITTQADVNLAAVNYHFGSKKNLIQAVFRRYFKHLMPDIKTTLLNFQDDETTNITVVLDSILGPLESLKSVRSNGAEMFLLLLGRGYNESQGHLRKFIQSEYGDVLTLLIHTLHKSVPWVTRETLFWRLHFALGSVVFSMAARNALSDIAQADFNHPIATPDILNHLIPFIAQGIGAKSER